MEYNILGVQLLCLMGFSYVWLGKMKSIVFFNWSGINVKMIMISCNCTWVSYEANTEQDKMEYVWDILISTKV
jgi:hypothetical protein